MAQSCSFFWAWWLPLMIAIAAAADEKVESCSGNTCGNLTISDPFWLTDIDTGRSCGSLEFEITCFNNTPLLPSAIPMGYGFEVLDISYENQSMRVVDTGDRRLLPDSNSCNQPIWNTSKKLRLPFRIDPVNLDLILYNCTNAAPMAAMARRDRELVGTRMRCGSDSRVFVGMEGRYVEGCNATVLPVLANREANASDYERLIVDGFLLTWENPPPPGSSKLIHPIVQFPLFPSNLFMH